MGLLLNLPNVKAILIIRKARSVRVPPNEQLNLTLYPGLCVACAKPQPRVKRKLTRC